jgi:hypothetical protein
MKERQLKKKLLAEFDLLSISFREWRWKSKSSTSFFVYGQNFPSGAKENFVAVNRTPHLFCPES